MPRFLVMGHGGKPAATKEGAEQAMARWGAWFAKAGDAIVDVGSPFVGRGAVGNVEHPTRANGFMIVRAPDLEAAKKLVASSPAADEGQGLEVFELRDMEIPPPDA